MKLPIIHFQGNFRFHMPEQNNSPQFVKTPIDNTLSLDEIKMLCGCNPAKYFEFYFENVKINKVSNSTENTVSQKSLIGKHIALKGFLPDVSPSAICSQLFAGVVTIENILEGKLEKAIQSILRLNIRPQGFNDETAAAHYTTNLIDNNSKEVYEFHMHLNRYTKLNHVGDNEPDSSKLSGQVFGYIKPKINSSPELKFHKRKLIKHSKLNPKSPEGKIYLDFNGNNPRLPDHLKFWHEIDGTYDIDWASRQIHLNPLHFIPYLDRQYTTPTLGSTVNLFTDFYLGYEIILKKDGHEFILSRVNESDGEGFKGDQVDLIRNGGLYLFKIPQEIKNPENISLEINLLKQNKEKIQLLEDSIFDLVIDGHRGVYMKSKSELEVFLTAYKNNIPCPDIEVEFITQDKNRRSPTVASFKNKKAKSNENGKVVMKIVAVDLMNANQIYDPVTRRNYDVLPLDRQYGNFLWARIANSGRNLIEYEYVEFAVRVLKDVTPYLEEPQLSFEEHIQPIFAYITRYFPYLHVSETANGYYQFLDLDDEDQFLDQIDGIINRLELNKNDWKHMPRSRDLPYGAIEVIKKFRDENSI